MLRFLSLGLQLGQQTVEQLQIGRQLHAREGLILPVREEAQVDCVPGVEERAEELLGGYRCFVHKHSFLGNKKARPVWSCLILYIKYLITALFAAFAAIGPVRWRR